MYRLFAIYAPFSPCLNRVTESSAILELFELLTYCTYIHLISSAPSPGGRDAALVCGVFIVRAVASERPMLDALWLLERERSLHLGYPCVCRVGAVLVRL